MGSGRYASEAGWCKIKRTFPIARLGRFSNIPRRPRSFNVPPAKCNSQFFPVHFLLSVFREMNFGLISNNALCNITFCLYCKNLTHFLVTRFLVSSYYIDAYIILVWLGT